MTYLLTAEKVQKELAGAESAALREVNPDLQRAYRGIARICRGYLTLLDRVAGLEQQVEVQRKNLEWFNKQLQDTERDD